MASVPIQNAFDIGAARNLLRKKLSGMKWQPPFRARATTTVVMMGELILMSQKSGVLEINVIMGRDLWGVEVKCKIGTDEHLVSHDVYHQLQRIADSVEVTAKEDYVYVTAKLRLV
jgi:hypothetical protein